MSTPMLVAWNLTRLCNLACSHCYLPAVQRRREAADELGTARALGVVGQIAAAAPGAMLVFTGGEPLLRRDLVDLVDAAAKAGLTPVIGSNGTLLTRRRAGTLKAAGAAAIGISLDSASAAFHDRLRGRDGAWAAALRGAHAAREAGIALLVNATVFAENRGELDALVGLTETIGAVALNFFFLVCTGRGVTRTDLAPAAGDETLAQIIALQQAHPKLVIRARCAPYTRRLLGLRAGESAGGYADWSGACLAGRSYVRITAAGKVTPCPYIPETLGDLETTTLREIWDRHPVLVRLRTELPAGKCGDCDYRFSCGGCRARALAGHGDVMAEDPQCPYVRPKQVPPEARPEATTSSAANWDAAAAALLARIPAFVRARVSAMVERRAAAEGIGCITEEFLRSCRPPVPFARPPTGNASGGVAGGQPWPASS